EHELVAKPRLEGLVLEVALGAMAPAVRRRRVGEDRAGHRGLRITTLCRLRGGPPGLPEVPTAPSATERSCQGIVPVPPATGPTRPPLSRSTLGRTSFQSGRAGGDCVLAG